MNAIKITDLAGRDRLWGRSSHSPTLKSLETTYRAAIDAGARLTARRGELSSSGSFTGAGISAEAAKFVRETMLPEVARGRIAIQRAKRQVTDRRNKIKPPAPDKTDLVGFFRRESIRDALARLSREERDLYLARHAAGDLDPEIAAAVLEHIDLPWTKPEALFVSPETRAALLRRAVAAEHGEALSSIEELEEAITATESVFAAQTEVVRAELAVRPDQLDALIHPLEQAEVQKAPPIWLRNVGDRVVTIVPGGTQRDATPDQIAAGVFFADIAEYTAAMRAA